jgi:hypothetical protein
MLLSRAAGLPAENRFWNFARGLIRDLERRMTIRPEVKQ